MYIADNQMMHSTLVMMTKLTAFKLPRKAVLSNVIIKMQYMKDQFQLVSKLHNNLSSICININTCASQLCIDLIHRVQIMGLYEHNYTFHEYGC